MVKNAILCMVAILNIFMPGSLLLNQLKNLIVCDNLGTEIISVLYNRSRIPLTTKFPFGNYFCPKSCQRVEISVVYQVKMIIYLSFYARKSKKTKQ